MGSLIDKIIDIYNLDWQKLPIPERVLQIARYFADYQKVKEEGVNRGFWVEKFLQAVGLPGGYAWCAAFVTYCLRQAGWKEKFNGMASVRKWYQWASKNAKLIPYPERGCLFGWLRKDGTGHMGFVTNVEITNKGTFIKTIEGNTNIKGAREGDKVARLVRPEGMNFFYIRPF